ncbi:hypothetical protein PLANPX_5237 [Lacipirellula parvula]|uniref:Uncharacterized protein n=1 Tax=Lacipirellula parvula TaxID=2650471 RepID=A0A5K7XGV7_9BACT|nr:hypothetical protein PLANPX_5237 [Lacipirellula parvula]
MPIIQALTQPSSMFLAAPRNKFKEKLALATEVFLSRAITFQASH